MDLTRQGQVESDEKALEAYRRGRFHGSARVSLDNLTFEEGFSHLMDDGRNIHRLKWILKLQGCLRISPQYHVPVLIDAADWGRVVTMCESRNEFLPELAMTQSMKLRAQRHESIIAAARETLSGERRWWVVDVYVDDPSTLLPASPTRVTLFIGTRSSPRCMYW